LFSNQEFHEVWIAIATIQANTTAAYTLGITIDASDVVTVYASSANISFNAFGSEIA
jgi:hypothetical protein